LAADFWQEHRSRHSKGVLTKQLNI